MTTRIVVMLSLTLVTTACSPAGYRAGTPFNSQGARLIGPTYDVPAQPPFGRWDNVMMLPAGAMVQVLLMDGSLAAGPIVSAAADRVRIHTASGDVDVPFTNVMRIDRQVAPGSALQDGARGATFGAAVVSVLGLMAGRIPPPRLFLAGAVVGAYETVELRRLAGQGRIVYVAPPVTSSGWRPAAQYRPR
jgi:hypothetical protein